MKLFKLFQIMALCLVLLPIMPLFSQSPIVKIEPAGVSVDVGETFTVNVDIEGASNLRGISIKIGFDPEILTAQSISSGGFLSAFGQTFSFSDKNNEEGWTQYDESILGSGDMADGDGIVCQITFESVGLGSSPLAFTTADLRDDDNIPIDTATEDGTVIVGGSAVLVQVTVALEGPYDAEKSAMATRLKEQNLIPLNSPYDDAAESVGSIPDDVVDWVLVQLRKSPTGATVAEKSCFLKSNGSVVQTDGQVALTFQDVEEGGYYLIVQHRNHLAVMSAEKAALSATATAFDFTKSLSKYYGGQAKLLKNNPDVFGMYAGDGDKDEQIGQMDKAGVLSNRDTVNYSTFDYNCSGIITISDMDYAVSNTGKSTNVAEN